MEKKCDFLYQSNDDWNNYYNNLSEYMSFNKNKIPSFDSDLGFWLFHQSVCFDLNMLKKERKDKLNKIPKWKTRVTYKKLIKAIQNGDGVSLKYLMNMYLPFIEEVVSKCKDVTSDSDFIFQIAYETIYFKTLNWDFNNKTNFSQSVKGSIESNINRYFEDEALNYSLEGYDVSKYDKFISRRKKVSKIESLNLGKRYIKVLSGACIDPLQYVIDKETYGEFNKSLMSVGYVTRNVALARAFGVSKSVVLEKLGIPERSYDLRLGKLDSILNGAYDGVIEQEKEKALERKNSKYSK